jgi:hypothetical protein
MKKSAAIAELSKIPEIIASFKEKAKEYEAIINLPTPTISIQERFKQLTANFTKLKHGSSLLYMDGDVCMMEVEGYFRSGQMLVMFRHYGFLEVIANEYDLDTLEAMQEMKNAYEIENGFEGTGMYARIAQGYDRAGRDGLFPPKPKLPKHLQDALNNDLWKAHKSNDTYTMDAKPQPWKIAYYPIFEDAKTGKQYAEPRALVESPIPNGIDFREVPLRYLTKIPKSEAVLQN